MRMSQLSGLEPAAERIAVDWPIEGFRGRGRRFFAPDPNELRTPFCLSSGNLGGVDFSAALSDEREDLSGEITLQGSNGVEFGMPFRDPTSNIVLGSLIGS